MKTVIWATCLIFCSSIFLSCSEEQLEPTEYFVRVNNNYFEVIDSVKLSTYHLSSIDTGQVSDEVLLNKSNYPFSFFSASGLFFETEISIQGLKKNLDIIIHENGQITIN